MSAICKGDCLQPGRWSSSHVGANCIRAQGCSVLALAHVYVVCTCRSGAIAQPHHHASKATALSLALHMAERAASGKAGMHSQGCSAPSIAQMQGSRGRNPPMHILLLSGESSRKVGNQASSLSPPRCVRNALFILTFGISEAWLLQLVHVNRCSTMELAVKACEAPLARMQAEPGSQRERSSSARSADGSVEEEAALAHIGDWAARLGAIVDVVATAGNPPNVKHLLQVAQRTGGTVMCCGRS